MDVEQKEIAVTLLRKAILDGEKNISIGDFSVNLICTEWIRGNEPWYIAAITK